MTLFFHYIFIKTDMSGVEQVGLSNREYSPDSYVHYHLAAEKALLMLGELLCFIVNGGSYTLI